MTKQRGFTLFEILVAIFILAIIGTIMVSGLKMIITSEERVTQNAEQISDLNLALTILQNDINNIVNRSVNIGNNTIRPGLLLNNDGTNTLEFTRTGLTNPLNELRSDLLRVDYQLQNGELIRNIWPALDRLPQTKPISRVLLKKIKQIQWQFLASNLRFYPNWTAAGSALPRAIQVTIIFENDQTVQLLFLVNNATNRQGNNRNAITT